MGLVLERNDDKAIWIGDDIVIRIVGVRMRGKQVNGSVKILIEAPPELVIEREELRKLRLQSEKREVR